MAITRIQSESMNLADTYAFTGTVSGTNTFVKLHQITASSSDSTVIFNNTYINDTYDVYRFYLKNVSPVTDATSLRCQFSLDNGSTYITSSDYSKVAFEGHQGTADDVINSRYSNGSGSIQLTGSASTQGNELDEATSGHIDFYNGIVDCKRFQVFLTYRFNGAQTVTSQATHELRGQRTSRVTAIKFYQSSGNFASGVFTLYGVKNA